MQPQITIRELAKHCGLHFTTVALALRNSPKVSQETQRRVQKLAKELNYRPNPMVSALMAQKRALKKPEVSSAIAYVSFAKRGRRVKEHSFEGLYFQGATDRAYELGYKVEKFELYESGINAARLAQIFNTRAIYGILLGPSRQSKGHLPHALHPFRAVTVGPSIVRPGLHRVTHNHYQGCLLACRQLRKRGCSRIGLALSTLMDSQMDRLWTAGYLAFSQGIPAPDRLTPLYLPKEEFPTARILEWIEQEKPQVILTMHIQLKEWLEEHGNLLSRPLEIATLDYHRSWGNCPGIWQKPEVLGQEAVSLLIGQLQSNLHGLPNDPVTLMLDGEWREGPAPAP